MESQEVSITRACKLVGSPGDELHVFFLDALLIRRTHRFMSRSGRSLPYTNPSGGSLLMTIPLCIGEPSSHLDTRAVCSRHAPQHRQLHSPASQAHRVSDLMRKAKSS
jgi:hypothetical protein